MYAILGDYKFQNYKGFKELKVSDGLAISEHPRIEGKPRLQATGEKLREISLTFLLHASFSDPDKDIEILQSYRRGAQIIPFLSGDGISFGEFVIKEINTGFTQTDKKGSTIGVEVEVILLEAVTPDSGNTKPERLAVRNPGLILPALPARPTEPQSIFFNLRQINTQTNAIVKDLSFAAKVAAATDRAIRTSKRRVDNIRAALVNIEKTGTETQKIFSSYQNIKGQADRVKGSTESLALFLQAGDLNSSINASGQLRNTLNKLNIDAAPINNLTAVRKDQESQLAGGSDHFDIEFPGAFV